MIANRQHEQFIEKVKPEEKKEEPKQEEKKQTKQYSLFDFLEKYYIIILLVIIIAGSIGIYYLNKKDKFDF